MHIALRAPRDKSFFVDGEDVVPGVHAVLDKAINTITITMMTVC